ncbi:hypothetical protein AMAG_07552 [Allomyces macrogynus ATCC 38327]|uniref:Methyltransferase type 11 domain-containing protein n=1 Tax=Allomyces macrogynus (strain ATCC 38327) TaxID=578462 RepID=A0A0L0SIH1_ALLM3|nr:hypothetical protein AMAG_07552 [Allomyces macrogynus ATCC 38327]|eukprot:KNE62321.1 hypothetical protein AMAG_07552 [Allomyces macrogynus ATCC 38327]
MNGYVDAPVSPAPTAQSRFASPSKAANDARKPLGDAQPTTAPWSPEKIASFYGAYAAKYDQEIEADLAAYPAPFVLGAWVIEWLRAHGKDLLAQNTAVQVLDVGTTTPYSIVDAVNAPAMQAAECEPVLRVLDLGCGTGQSSRMLFRAQSDRDMPAPVEVHGIDTTMEMLERAAARPFTSLTCANIEHLLPYAIHAFHAVICVGVMEFVADVGGLLDQLSRITTAPPHGDGAPAPVVAVTMPERAPGVASERADGDLNAWTRAEMEAMFAARGWWVERHERMHGYADSQTGAVTYYHAFLLQKRA